MKRGVFLLLILSLGLNLGLLYKQFIAPGDGVSSRDRSAQEDQRRLDLPLDQIIAHRLERMTEHLNLDERQQQSTKEILQEFSPQILERRRELDQSRADLHRGDGRAGLRAALLLRKGLADGPAGVGQRPSARRHVRRGGRTIGPGLARLCRQG